MTTATRREPWAPGRRIASGRRGLRGERERGHSPAGDEEANGRKAGERGVPGSFAGLFKVGRNCEAVARAPRAAFLIDGEAYFRAFVQAAEQAERSILILAWDFDSRTVLSFGE